MVHSLCVPISNTACKANHDEIITPIAIAAVLILVGHSTAHADQTATHPVSSAHIESSSLRVEFDKNMRSRVIARLNGTEFPIGAFSASETIKGNECSWYNFALASQTRERITDIYGAGEKLNLAGISGGLRKNVSIIVYDDFPNLAVFQVCLLRHSFFVSNSSRCREHAAPIPYCKRLPAMELSRQRNDNYL